MTSRLLAAALRDAAALGPYFATDEVGGAGWQPLAALLGNAEVNRQLVAATRRDLALRHHAGLGGVEARVAASIHFLDCAARVLSPALAVAVLADAVPELTPRNTWWRPRRSGAVTLGIGAARAAAAGAPQAAAERVRALVFGPVLVPLARAYRQRFGLAELLLWGNVASALVGAAGQLTGRRPEAAARTDVIVRMLLDAAPLAPAVLSAPPEFRRNSCCLYYRLPEGGLCGDCVLGVKRDVDEGQPA